mgnify:CR=1 FL=1
MRLYLAFWAAPSERGPGGLQSTYRRTVVGQGQFPSDICSTGSLLYPIEDFLVAHAIPLGMEVGYSCMLNRPMCQKSP